MAKKKYEESNIQAIATTIREKTGSNKLYNTSEMASGVNEVYEAGKAQGEGDFWDVVLSGRGTNFEYGFTRWGFEWFRPPRKIVPTERQICMFMECKKLKKIEKDYLDLSNVTTSNTKDSTSGNYATFRTCTKIEEIEDVGMPAGSYYYTFGWCYKLHTIAVMRCNAKAYYTAPFTNCNALKNLTIEGEIGSSFPIPDSPLSVESMKNIISHLKDYSTEEVADNHYKYTVTFKTSAFEAIESEGATAEYNGVACTWAELIDNKKWNLVKA